MALKVHAGVRPQSKVLPSGVRPQSKVAGDCTLGPDPRAAEVNSSKKIQEVVEIHFERNGNHPIFAASKEQKIK